MFISQGGIPIESLFTNIPLNETIDTYKLFSTGCNNSSKMKIGLTGFDVHEFLRDAQA